LGLVTAKALRAADITTPSKTLTFNVAGSTSGVNTILATSSTSARTITLPDATTTLVGHNNTQTLSNKTLASLVLSGTVTTTTGSNDNISLSPDGTGLVILGNTDGVIAKGLAHADPTDVTKRIYFDTSGATTAKGLVIFSEHTDDREIILPDATTILVGVDTIDGLSNKTFIDAPEMNAGVDLQEESSISNPSAGYRRMALKTDGKIYLRDSSGNETSIGSDGGSGINYVTNGEFEANVDGWTAVGTITITRSASSPLRGTASGVITNGANNDYIKYPFTIADADKAKILRISFDIDTGALADNELQVSIYDATNLVTIPVVDGNIKAGVGRYIGEFQTASNSNSYELRITQIAETSGWTTAKIDNVQVGPREIARGSVVTDWISFTPTITSGAGTISATLTGKYRRVGDSAQVYLKYQYGSGTGAAAAFHIGLPFTFDSSKYPSDQVIGSGYWYSTATGFLNTDVRPVTTSSVIFTKDAVSGFLQGTDADDAGSAITTTFIVPVSGWSSNTTMSSDFGGRDVVFHASGTPTGTVNGSYNTLTYPTVSKNTVSMSYSSGVLTILESGFYDLSAGVRYNKNTWGAAESCEVAVYKNSSTQLGSGLERAWATVNTGLTPQVTLPGVYLSAGETVEVKGAATTGATLSSSETAAYFYVAKRSSQQTLRGGEVVAAVFTTSAGQSIANSTTTIIDYGNTVINTHGAVTTGASWKFTAPVSGIYEISAAIQYLALGGWAAGEEATLNVYKGGSLHARLGAVFMQATHSTFVFLSGSPRLISLNAGEYIDIRTSQNSGASLSLTSTAAENWISIKKVN
jgi:hypothetical protein